MRDGALIGETLFRADAENPDTYLCVLPLSHSFGQTVIQNGALAYGATAVMLPLSGSRPRRASAHCGWGSRGDRVERDAGRALPPTGA